MPPAFNDDEVEQFIAYLISEAARSNPYGMNPEAHLMDRQGVINTVRLCMGDAAAEHAARTHPLQLH